MSIDLIESVLACGQVDPDDLARRWAASYRWSRGYEPGAARTLKLIARGTDWRSASRAVYANGSYGNGAAMRAPILGLIFAESADQLAEAVRASALVTHAHPLAVEGARLIAAVTGRVASSSDTGDIISSAMSLCELNEYGDRLALARDWLATDQAVPNAEVARRLGHGIAAHQSCVTAVYLALKYRHEPFLDLLQVVRRVGGDVDTIGAMAGAIWGAANGYSKLPADRLARLEQRARLEDLAAALYESLSNRSAGKAL